jgi:8-oxo-dGTP pyrophosphatase MutT (NUDIX family)
MMELWDLYGSDRRLLNRTHERGAPLGSGEYHLVVDIVIMNKDNKILITKRDTSKRRWPGKWEYTGGCVLAGEDSLTGAIREVNEETGIKLKPEMAKLIYTKTDKNYIKDVYLFRENVNIKDTKLQENETVDIKLVDENEFNMMMDNGEVMDVLVNEYREMKRRSLL